MTSNPNFLAQIKTDTGLCVACGLCLPKCPTYRLTATENESPRGRISLIRALAEGELPANRHLESHLALCLTCRACEQVCPSRVPYGRIIDQGRALLEQRRRPRLKRRLGKWLMDHLLAQPAVLRRVTGWVRAYQHSGLQHLLRASGLLSLFGLKRHDALLPAIPDSPAWQAHYPAMGQPQGKVGFFSGCLTSALDTPTQLAAINLLNLVGYDVNLPGQQTCCGGLHRHEGYIQDSARLMLTNLQAFDDPELEAIIVTASGCGAMLADYGSLSDNTAGRQFAGKVHDVAHFLARAAWPSSLVLEPLPRRIAVHEPCTLRNTMHQQQATYALLNKIPQAEIMPLPDNGICCGGAGVYPLTQPTMARRLRDNKLAHLRQLRPDILVTSNIGCALHLAAGLREEGLAIEVVHPIVLLAQQAQEKRDKSKE